MSARILDEETIRWISVKDALPDDKTTVLMFAPEVDEPVWPGYHDSDGWFNTFHFPCAPGAVTAWAPMPKGPAR